jgi:hypothetical protein
LLSEKKQLVAEKLELETAIEESVDQNQWKEDLANQNVHDLRRINQSEAQLRDLKRLEVRMVNYF